MGELVAPPLADCLRVLNAHRDERVAALPQAARRWRRAYYNLCPECGREMPSAEPMVLNGPAVDTRDGSIVDRGPITLLWSCSRGCRSVEPSCDPVTDR